MPPGARLCLTSPTCVPDCVSDGRRPGNTRTSSAQLLVCAIVASAQHNPFVCPRTPIFDHKTASGPEWRGLRLAPARPGRFSNPLTVPVPAAPNPPKGPAASYSSQPAAEFAAMELTRDVAVSGAACGARLRASAGGGCGPHGSKEPHDTTAIVARTFVPHSPRHPFQRLFLASCCGLPQRNDGSPGERRHERVFALVLAACCRPGQNGLSGLLRRPRWPTRVVVPFRRFSRALRPSICPEAVFTIFSLSLACVEDTSASGMLK